MSFNLLDASTKPKVSSNLKWRLVRSMRAYDEYRTGRNDIVRFKGDMFVHMGDVGFSMSGRVWLQTLCGVTYAVYPDPLTSTTRHDVALLERYPPGTPQCAWCEDIEAIETKQTRNDA